MDSKLFTLHTIETFWNKIKNKFYVKSANGIPKSDLDTTVQSSLSKADSALQKHQDISGKLDKTGDASTTTVAFSAASARENVKTGEKLSVILGKIAKWFSDLKNVAFTGSYNDLSDVPEEYKHPTYEENSIGFYKFANDGLGHVSDAEKVTKQDIVDLGIPGSIPIYNVDVDEEYGYSEGMIIATIVVNQNAHAIGVPIIGENENADYGLMSASDKKKLDGMDLSKYLPKSGGVMTGDINMATNRKDIVVGSNPASNRSEGTAIAGGSFNASTDFTQEICARKTFIGSATDKTGTWYNVLSVRHRNGAGDGVNFGMYLRSLLTSEDNLIWNKQTGADNWQGERTLLDSVNFTDYALAKDGTAKKADCLSTGQLKFGYIYNSTSTATAGKTWARVAYCVVPKGYTTITMSMLVTGGNSGIGLYEIDFRSNANNDRFEYFNVRQIITNLPERVTLSNIKAFAKSTSDGMQYEIWCNIIGIYGTRQFVCLSEQQYSGANSNEWKFETHTADDFVSSPPTDGMEATYSNCGVVSTAETLTDSGWVTCPLAVTGNTTYPSSSSSIKVRKYGKLVRLEAVVKYTTTFGTGHNVAKIPEGYRPSSVQKEHGIITVASERIEFDATLGVGGNLSFAPAGSSSAKFNPGNSYECRMTYFID